MRLVWIRKPGRTRLVETRDLVGVEGPAGRAEIVVELIEVARPDDRCGHAGTAEQPVKRDLGVALAGRLDDRVERIDDGPGPLVAVALEAFAPTHVAGD